MNIEEIRAYALSLTDVTEGFPFGESVLVFKTAGKIFLLLPLDTPDTRFNVKCEPERALELRERYPDQVLPGFHMNKTHWNTVVVGPGLTRSFLLEQILHSYERVKPRNKRKE